MSSSHSPRSLRSWTRCGLTTVKSPDMLDLTNRLRYSGSMDWPTPQMLEIVAVGAMAITLELRIPLVRTRSRRVSQSSRVVRSTSKFSPPRAWATSSRESIGRMPRLHSEPSKDS